VIQPIIKGLIEVVTKMDLGSAHLRLKGLDAAEITIFVAITFHSFADRNANYWRFVILS